MSQIWNNSMDADLLTDMATFAAVVDNNGFSAAATALQTSKSNVSRRVASLETRLAIKLMHRTTRKLTLTESGRLYYEHCARLVSDAKDADDAIKQMHSAPSGTLNLSVPEALGRAFILPLLPEFLALYPSLQLNLTITSRNVASPATQLPAIRCFPWGLKLMRFFLLKY